MKEKEIHLRPISGGREFGKLTVVKSVTEPYYECRCDCGNVIAVAYYNLLSGKEQSCGACRPTPATKPARRERPIAPPRPTIPARPATYSSWHPMVCKAKKHCTGFVVCDEWLVFENFVRDMGDRPDGYGLSRIDDNKPFSKKNCEWLPLGEIHRRAVAKSRVKNW